MVKGLIFDLDQTLVDSSCAEIHRKNRDWNKVYTLIPAFQLYDGMPEVFNFIRSNNIKVCIVTTSPGVYAKKVIAQFNIPCNNLVDYFSTQRKKPFADPMIKAIELLNLSSNEVLSFGDRTIDIEASNSAKIKSVACLWGSNETTKLKLSNPSYIIAHPSKIIEMVK